jgi:peptidyl-prolyl cis-trans isomerase SurA
MRKFGIAVLSLLLITSFARAQRVLDKVAAVVGNGIILQSDIESTYAQYILQGIKATPALKCQLMQSLVTQKLLAQQAVIDSVTVKDDEVDEEVDRRMRAMIQRAGGEDRLAQFLGRPILQYKDEIRPDIRERMVAQQMQQKITSKVNVTPQDVQKFFDEMAKDSLPYYNKEVEVGEIVINPELNKAEKQEARDKLEALRQRIKGGEDFGQMARLYSQDASAQDGGDLGFFDRTAMAKEFTAMVFKMKAGEISPVFETEFGFHIVQVLERRGEQVHARHIIIIPQITQASIDRAKIKADSIYTLINHNSKIDFSTAASIYSDDKETKYNGGMMLNYDNVQSRTTHIPMDKLDPQIALVVDTMKVGEISTPVLTTDQNGKKKYAILYLKSVTDAHKANMEQDFPKIKEMAFTEKTNRAVSEWFENKRKSTYIRIDNEYQSCPEIKNWTTNTTAKVNP